MKIIKFKHLLIGALLAVLITSFTFAAQQDNEISNDSARKKIVQALSKELKRSQKELHMEGFESPYFISYQLQEAETVGLFGTYGGIQMRLGPPKRRTAFVEIRVGDYKFDNTNREQRRGSRSPFFRRQALAPLDNDENSLRAVFWKLTDVSYKRAISDYQSKKGEMAFASDKENADDFAPDIKKTNFGPIKKLKLNENLWADRIREVTRSLAQVKGIFDPTMRVVGTKISTYYVNTEGSTITTDEVYYEVNVNCKTRADDGMLLQNFRTFATRIPEELPNDETLNDEVKRMAEELMQLREAEVLQPYNGPAILAPDVAGVLFHEAIGHRLEGERQRAKQEQQTFKGKVGQQVIPEFLTVIDDPTLNYFQGKTLNGTYQYDDEGVTPERVVLIEDGVLRTFLLSRTPIEGFPQSNGHARKSPGHGLDPMARMSNLIIESKKIFSPEELKQMLIEEVKQQGKPYGLILKHNQSGITGPLQTGRPGAFRVTPILVYTVNVDNGQETLVRGVDLVGTPLISINKIMATGNNYTVFQGVCRAKSGIINVSTIAPTMLLQEIELQKAAGVPEQPTILPSPFWPDSEIED